MSAILFVDRDGTLIEEPADFQIDRFDKLRFVPGVIPAMLQLREAGYEFVMVTNQDGLGTESCPRATFDGPHDLMMQVFASQGIDFRDVLIDTSFPADNAPTRKPGLGLVQGYLRDRSIDWSRSAMIGDRETDVQFARNLGIRAFQLKTAQFGGDWDWAGIAHALLASPRVAQVDRHTKETRVEVRIDLDRPTDPVAATGLGFFDHMLEQLGKHGAFGLALRCEGDLHIDEHHTVEDCGLALGQAFKQALGDKRGIGRYGFTLPMDETLASAALDFSGRPYFVFDGSFRRERVGELPTELVPHFFRSLCETAGLNLHLKVEGDNDHH
jgi:imidazoleglycerol-phosphate dehydratase/histidinol-phosphatase